MSIGSPQAELQCRASRQDAAPTLWTKKFRLHFHFAIGKNKNCQLFSFQLTNNN